MSQEPLGPDHPSSPSPPSLPRRSPDPVQSPQPKPSPKMAPSSPLKTPPTPLLPKLPPPKTPSPKPPSPRPLKMPPLARSPPKSPASRSPPKPPLARPPPKPSVPGLPLRAPPPRLSPRPPPVPKPPSPRLSPRPPPLPKPQPPPRSPAPRPNTRPPPPVKPPPRRPPPPARPPPQRPSPHPPKPPPPHPTLEPAVMPVPLRMPVYEPSNRTYLKAGSIGALTVMPLQSALSRVFVRMLCPVRKYAAVLRVGNPVDLSTWKLQCANVSLAPRTRHLLIERPDDGCGAAAGPSVARLSIQHLFSWRAYNLTIPVGYVSALSLLITAALGAVFLMWIVERAKKCLDFASTCFMFHFFFCWHYEGFPARFEWWLVNGLGLIIMSLLGEWLCLRREMQEIPLNTLRGRGANGGAAAASGSGGAGTSVPGGVVGGTSSAVQMAGSTLSSKSAFKPQVGQQALVS
ncbi:hypothetical protein VOLCADRAFT_121272, partial [Volvox carteri f. nagariensis]